jgi:hypothetical protein
LFRWGRPLTVIEASQMDGWCAVTAITNWAIR